MTRQTSIDAYREIEENGGLSTMRLVVLEILAKHGPLTANELRQYGDPKINSGIYTTRFSELRRMGLIYEVEQRPCKMTGVRAISWNLTGNTIPKKLEKEPTFKERKQLIIDKLVVHGKKSMPSTRKAVSEYKQELRDIYHLIEKL